MWRTKWAGAVSMPTSQTCAPPMFRVEGLGFRSYAFGFRFVVSGLGLGVPGFWVQGFGSARALGGQMPVGTWRVGGLSK